MSNETKRDQKENMQEAGKAGDGGTEREGEGGAGGGEQRLLRLIHASADTCVGTCMGGIGMQYRFSL
jgi:hypothetical protein